MFPEVPTRKAPAIVLFFAALTIGDELNFNEYTTTELCLQVWNSQNRALLVMTTVNTVTFCPKYCYETDEINILSISGALKAFSTLQSPLQLFFTAH